MNAKQTKVKLTELAKRLGVTLKPAKGARNTLIATGMSIDHSGVLLDYFEEHFGNVPCCVMRIPVYEKFNHYWDEGRRKKEDPRPKTEGNFALALTDWSAFPTEVRSKITQTLLGEWWKLECVRGEPGFPHDFVIGEKLFHKKKSGRVVEGYYAFGWHSRSAGYSVFCHEDGTLKSYTARISKAKEIGLVQNWKKFLPSLEELTEAVANSDLHKHPPSDEWDDVALLLNPGEPEWKFVTGVVMPYRTEDGKYLDYSERKDVYLTGTGFRLMTMTMSWTFDRMGDGKKEYLSNEQIAAGLLEKAEYALICEARQKVRSC